MKSKASRAYGHLPVSSISVQYLICVFPDYDAGLCPSPKALLHRKRVQDRNSNIIIEDELLRKTISPVFFFFIVDMFAALLLCTPLVWLAWKVLRLYLTRSPLDNVPGPPRASWLTGMCGTSPGYLDIYPRLIGNLEQFFDLYDWQYIDDICDTYGPVVKVQGAFGVRSVISPRLATLI